MLKHMSRTQLIGGWLAAVIVCMAGSVVAGATLTMGAVELWLLAGIVPPAVTLLLWHGAPDVTAAEIMRSADRRPND